MLSPVRFALLKHDWPFLHLDFLLQSGDSLLTWRLPPDVKHFPIAAVSLPRHRLLYLDYEGPVSHQRGHVQRVDAGLLRWLVHSEVFYLFELFGQKWSGSFLLRKKDTGWWLEKIPHNERKIDH